MGNEESSSKARNKIDSVAAEPSSVLHNGIRTSVPKEKQLRDVRPVHVYLALIGGGGTGLVVGSHVPVAPDMDEGFDSDMRFIQSLIQSHEQTIGRLSTGKIFCLRLGGEDGRRMYLVARPLPNINYLVLYIFNVQHEIPSELVQDIFTHFKAAVSEAGVIKDLCTSFMDDEGLGRLAECASSHKRRELLKPVLASITSMIYRKSARSSICRTFLRSSQVSMRQLPPPRT